MICVVPDGSVSCHGSVRNAGGSLPVPVHPFDDSDADALAQAIIKLPVKQKEVILLYYYPDMTMKEIADTLGINVSSVSGRLKHAHTKLRNLLEKEDAYE